MVRVQERLKSIEKDDGISEQWSINGELYQNYFKYYHSDRQRNLKKELRTNIEKCQFSLRQKAKYGGKR